MPRVQADTVPSAQGLIQRVIPHHASQIVVESIPAKDGRDVFEIESKDGKIVLRGNSGVSVEALGRTFMEETIRLFGNTHLWAADPFHESSPPKPRAQYLDAVGRAIHGLRKEVDPQAIWAMQAWSIRKEIAEAVPRGDLLVLDLSGNRNKFWGHNFIKGQLHNFGGRINLHGDLREVASNPFATTAAKAPQCVGMGLFPEAIMQNPVFYECVLDRIWRDSGADIDEWLKSYATRRYGAASAKADAAWQLLLHEGPYKPGTSDLEYSSMIAQISALQEEVRSLEGGTASPNQQSTPPNATRISQIRDIEIPALRKQELASIEWRPLWGLPAAFAGLVLLVFLSFFKSPQPLTKHA